MWKYYNIYNIIIYSSIFKIIIDLFICVHLNDQSRPDISAFVLIELKNIFAYANLNSVNQHIKPKSKSSNTEIKEDCFYGPGRF